MKKTHIFYILSILVLSFFKTTAQLSTHYIGTGTLQNSTSSYPAPYGNYYWGAKHQFLILASELTTSGMSAGNIYSLGFDVVAANGISLDDFEISLMQTNIDSISFFQTTGLTTVYDSSYTESVGWNQHTFTSPFYWDGTSNIIVQTCFNNTSFTDNAIVNMTTYSYDCSIYRRQDNSTVCTSTWGWPNGTENFKPNMRLMWQDPNTPPTANFNIGNQSSCSGTINFYDASTNSPISWLWDFGDGNTSTQQNPIHTFTSSGTYTVSLVVTNSFGNDTITQNNAITINLGGLNPVAPSCIPATTNGTLGFGITSVRFHNLYNTSGNASQGYSDFTCDSTAVYVGFSYPIEIIHDSPSLHNCAAWIDFNNDGVFDNTNEIIVSSTSEDTTIGTVLIPSNATLYTPLRMRVIADYDLSAFPTPCLDPDYGQAEDYTIIILQDTMPPTPNFTSDETFTCDGAIQFTDMSTNAPYAWAWDFGDGGTSLAQNPIHTYTYDSTYNVQLIATNQYGSDTILMSNYITVATSNSLISASCYPSTLGNCCKYGITNVTFNTINKFSADGNEGYQDFSCENQTYVDINTTYSISITTGPDNPQDTKVWIDFNNDGVFDNSNELFLNDITGTPNFNGYNPSGNITIPGTAIVSTPLRMRISSDEVGNNFTSCNDLFRGQAEDYAIIVNDTSCSSPSNLSTSNITDTTMDLSWTAGGSETIWNIEYGPSGFSQGMGTTLSGITSNPLTITGLSELTTYDFYVQADCSGAISAWYGPVTNTTTQIQDFTNISINIFPNPSNGIINLESINTTIKDIYIYNIIGEEIYYLNPLQKHLTINLSNFESGTYLLRCSDINNNSIINKIVLK